MEKVNLFVYGALMYEEVWNRIVSGNFKKIAGSISGYRRLAVKDEDYPGLVKGAGQVGGFIWLGVDRKNLNRLDEFEGEYYQRISVTATDNTQQQLDVDVYYFREQYRKLLVNREWSVDDFERQGLKKFLARYVGFNNTP